MDILRVAVLAVVAATIFSGVVNGQPPPNEPVKMVRLSGVITDLMGDPMANKSLEFYNFTAVSQTHSADSSTSTLTTRVDGGFVLTVRANDEYFVFLDDPDSSDPDAVTLNVGQIVVTGGWDLDLGHIVMKSRTKETHGGALS